MQDFKNDKMLHLYYVMLSLFTASQLKEFNLERNLQQMQRLIQNYLLNSSAIQRKIEEFLKCHASKTVLIYF